MIHIRSNSDKIYIIRKEIIKISILIQDMIEDDNDEQIDIPLPFDNESIEKMLKYCEHHEDPTLDIDVDSLFRLLRIADFLHINHLIQLCTSKISSLMKNKNPDELRKFFKIEGNFTPEEKLEFMQSHKWWLS
jgi:S-phase kinase-associated protein 1